MTKQEIAEFMAVKVLRAKKATIKDTYWFDWDNGRSDKTPMLAVNFIFSPDGFSAVWDVVEKHPQVTFTQFIPEPEYRVYIDFKDWSQVEATGKNRYEAFYKAIMEMWK